MNSNVGTEFSDAKRHDKARTMHANWYKRRMKVRIKRLKKVINVYFHHKMWGDLTKNEVKEHFREFQWAFGKSSQGHPSANTHSTEPADIAAQTKAKKSG